MRAIQIAVLSTLMRWLQAWTQMVSRRLSTAQRATTNSHTIHARVRPPQTRSTAADQTTEVPEPPADWLERTTPTQPPARWLTTIHKRAVDSSASIEATTSDQPSATNTESVQLNVNHAPRPMWPPARSAQVATQASSTEMLAPESITAVDQSASTATKPHDAIGRSRPLATTVPEENALPIERSGQPIVPQHRRTTQIKAEPIETESAVSSVQVFDDISVSTVTVENEPPFVQAPIDLKTANTRDTQPPDRPAERSRPVLQSPVFETPWADPRPHSTQTATLDSAQQIDLPALRSSAFQRSIETADDRREISLNSTAVSGPSQTWATFARADQAAPEVTAIESRWPTLLDEPRAPTEHVEVALRDWERLRRLDLEQRGLGWSA